MSGSTKTCPCGLPALYVACCGRWHRGENAPTAELLMRSRYSAFVTGEAEYLLRTWHPDTRPARLDLDEGVRYTRLEVLGTTGGALFDKEGTVHFRAHYTDGGQKGVMEEDSAFVREGGAWLYVDAA